MTLPVLILVAMAANPVAPTANPRDGLKPPAKEQIEASARKIKELQKERIDALEAAVDIQNTLFIKARGPFRDVMEARLLLLQAQLDMAEKRADRIALYKKAIGTVQDLEKIAAAHVKRGTETEASVLQAKARRLEVEIQLEREMMKEAKAGK